MNVVTFGTSKGAVEYAEGLLKRCLSGEVVAVTALEEQPGGNYVVLGNSTNSRTQTAGMPLDAAITRLMQE